jgi:hypothetical protein
MPPHDATKAADALTAPAGVVPETVTGALPVTVYVGQLTIPEEQVQEPVAGDTPVRVSGTLAPSGEQVPDTLTMSPTDNPELGETVNDKASTNVPVAPELEPEFSSTRLEPQPMNAAKPKPKNKPTIHLCCLFILIPLRSFYTRDIRSIGHLRFRVNLPRTSR